MQLPVYLARLLDNEADLGQPYVFDASDDSGQIVFCPVTLTTEVVSTPQTSGAEDSVANLAPPDSISAPF